MGMHGFTTFNFSRWKSRLADRPYEKWVGDITYPSHKGRMALQHRGVGPELFHYSLSPLGGKFRRHLGFILAMR